MLKSKYLTKPKYLTKRQKGVLEDLFSGVLNEQEILEKWKVRRRTYHKWHGQEFFAAEFKRLLKLAQSQSELIFARYAADVAAKLVSLAGTEKEDIARKACMYVINHPDRKGKNLVEIKELPETEPLPELPPEVASRLLAALAGEE
jgi:histone H3/H4